MPRIHYCCLVTNHLREAIIRIEKDLELDTIQQHHVIYDSAD